MSLAIDLEDKAVKKKTRLKKGGLIKFQLRIPELVVRSRRQGYEKEDKAYAEGGGMIQLPTGPRGTKGPSVHNA